MTTKSFTSSSFLRFSSSLSLEYNFYFGDLKYSPDFMTAKSFTASSVKIFK